MFLNNRINNLFEKETLSNVLCAESLDPEKSEKLINFVNKFNDTSYNVSAYNMLKGYEVGFKDGINVMTASLLGITLGVLVGKKLLNKRNK